MQDDVAVTRRWNRTAVPTAAVLFFVAEIAVYALFGNPRMPFTLLAGWFVVTVLVQFWGTRTDRIVALAALVLMVLTGYAALAVAE